MIFPKSLQSKNIAQFYQQHNFSGLSDVFLQNQTNTSSLKAKSIDNSLRNDRQNEVVKFKISPESHTQLNSDKSEEYVDELEQK